MANIFKLIVLIVNLSVCFSNNNVLNQQVPKFNNLSITSEKIIQELTFFKPISIISKISSTIENRLKSIRNNELGVPIIQSLYDSFQFSSATNHNETAIVDKLASLIEAKITPAIHIIEEMCSFLTNDNHNTTTFYSLLNPCPNDDRVEVKIDHFYNEIYNHNNQFDILNDKNLIFHKFLIENIAKVADDSWLSYRQYFLSTSDKGLVENCNKHIDDSRFMQLYISPVERKHVLLLIDTNSEMMDVTRAVAKSVIKVLNDTDSISVILISDKAATFSRSSQSCSVEAMYPVTSSTKNNLYDFLDSLNKTNAITDHALGFQSSFELIQRLYQESNSSKMLPISFLYISQGYPFSDPKHVLTEISKGQSKLKHPVTINTCAVIMDNRQIQFQSQLLQEISSQNYSKFNVDTTSWWHLKGNRSLIGNMFLMNKTLEDVNKLPITMLAELYNYKDFIKTELTLHHPYFDSQLSGDFIISITKSCGQRGIFGIDFFLNYLVEDILFSNQINFTYKFLTDMNGNTFAHSELYPRPSTIKENFKLVHILLLENKKEFPIVWDQMQYSASGSYIMEHEKHRLSYTWKHVNNLLIVCTVTKINGTKAPMITRIKSPNNQNSADHSKYLPELIYHRMDLTQGSFNSISLCHYFKQVATYESITLLLSAKAFVSPYSHMKNNRVEDNDDFHQTTIQSFMAYLKDNKNLFANPGMLPQVRNEVIGIYHIMEYLKKKHLDLKNDLRKYILRRYGASINGVLQVFPGCILDPNFEASKRPWFVKAMETPGRIAITEPYLDAGGAGYIVSVSYTVFEGKNSALHSPDRDQPIVVVGLDFTRGFFYKMILEASGSCSQDVKCFLMDDKGFLVGHPNFLEPIVNERQPEHISHKESHVANDILMHRKFVKKISCNNYLNGTSQRFYQFNTSLNDVITNWANVEKTKYQIVSVKGSNLFVGIINSTTETSGAFCPCSTIDRICLNCFRMEQLECECPCECRLEDDECATNKTDLADSLTCPQHVEYIQNYQAPQLKDPTSVDSCNFDFNCDVFVEKQDCLGVIGCIWCHTNDDETPLSVPFCSSQASCYNGVFGSYVDGYNNIVIDSIMNYNFLPPTYSAILPVIGVIVLLFLVVGFAMYCYKINYDSNGFGEHLYIDSQDNNGIGMMQMSRLDYDEAPHDEHNHEMGNNLNQSLLNSIENAVASNIQSPYRVATNYRHPNGYTDSSDHGYSTMGTHQDESEQQHPAMTNRGHNKRQSMSDSASVNTSISSPQNQQPYDLSLPLTNGKHSIIHDPSQTHIISPKKMSPHHVIAEVTVHRQMEAT